jgi:hypothetical protein
MGGTPDKAARVIVTLLYRYQALRNRSGSMAIFAAIRPDARWTRPQLKAGNKTNRAILI